MKYLIIPIILIAIWLGHTYNKLVRQNNMVDNQKSQIDIQLKRRFDLIPSLVEVVKGYAKHEKTTLEEVTKARNLFLNTDDTQTKLEADQQLSTALSRLFAIVESYPQLHANKNLLDLQKELSDTENKIAYARQFYNDSVFKLNNIVQMFPSNLVASIFNFKIKEYFEIDENQRESKQVEIE